MAGTLRRRSRLGGPRRTLWLHLAQQSVSQQVRQLEGLVGAPLLERSSRGTKPTQVGEVLVREAEVVRRGTTPQGLLALVAAGVGVTRLAASARSLRTVGVHFVELEGERAATVVLTRPGHTHPAIDALRRAAVEIA